MDATARFYSQPSYVGGGFPVFAGSRRQRGGSIFGAIAKAVLPALKTIGKSVLRQAGTEAFGLASDLANSALQGRSIKQTLRNQGLKRLRNVGRTALTSAMSTVPTSTRVPNPILAIPAPAPAAAAATIRGGPLRKRRRSSGAIAGKSGVQAKRRRRGGGIVSANF